MGSFRYHGRIGRLRYLQYLLLNLVLVTILNALFLAGSGLTDNLAVQGGLWLLAAILSLPMILGDLFLGIRRLHDLNLTGWLLLLGFIPYLNILFELFLLLMPGKETENRYGMP